MTKEDVLRESSEGDSVLGRYGIISHNSERPVIHQVSSAPMPSDSGERVDLYTSSSFRYPFTFSSTFSFCENVLMQAFK